MNLLVLSLVFIIYLFMVVYVGYIAYKRTDSSEDFLIAGRDSHPYVMALSYGATFISTAAIVGFGGIAGQYGMSILWLALLNLVVGIFIAFVFLGKRTRRIGANLKSVTFPDFLARRFDSKFLKIFSGLIIFLGMPIYSSVVLIGAARFMETSLGINFQIALFVFSIIIAAYVFYGGIKGVMYTDALQGTIMFCGMIFLLFFVFWKLGGIQNANMALTNMAPLYSKEAIAQGGLGWTAFPKFGSPFWWYLVSTLIMGVGIGTIAQPQLIVRFMTVKSDRELNRSVLIGGIFIAVMPVTAYVVGSLSNVYFYQKLGKTAVEVVGGNIDKIIPTFINMALPEWFVYVFLLTLLAASMSTLSALYHTQGTAFGSDVIGTIKNKKPTDLVNVTKVGILIAVVLSLILSFILPSSIIALGTSLFMGICAAAFLPLYIASIYWKGTTKAGAIAGVVSGLCTSLFCLLFMYKKTAAALGICQFLTGSPVLITTMPWPVVDPLLFGVPVSAIFLIVVSLITKPLDQELIDKSFKGFDKA
ncbi:MAG: sodium:solute symporter family protein [Methanobrevibacter boviskoreani]|jgi:SSS family solute:Na+ symporter|uniref:sodium:solute symporter family protein n=2 Tax=Methanobrevibacter boviskoreani TaxID=1348249 RepID=UPI000592B240|nr:sodium/solute symporter [Methanobrevibacter boviskoreani]MCI6931013.1 sodium/solute symporter [Methanobrevibacter boviskoreani]MDD6256065.1 sodium/solute symporter [Methanobrevibacter boviskoreani]